MKPIYVEDYAYCIGFIVLCLVSCILYIYAESGTPRHTIVTVFLCYASSFMMLLLVPIDISSVITNRRSNKIGTSDQYDDDINLLRPLYITFYLTMIFLASFVLLVQDLMNTDGFFTFWGRIKSITYRALQQYGLSLVFGFIVVAVLVGQGWVNSSNDLLIIIVLVCNTFNLFLLMLVLGFGLVAFPLQLWRKSDVKKDYKTIQNAAAAQFRHLSDMVLDQSKSVADLRMTINELERTKDDRLLVYAQEMLANAPQEFRSSARGTVTRDRKTNKVSESTLAALNCRLKSDRLRYRAAQAKLDSIKLKAYRNEDIIAAMDRTDGVKSISWTVKGVESTEKEFNWFMYYRPYLLKLSAIGAAILSLLSFLGIIGSINGVSSNTSPYYDLIQRENLDEVTIVFVIFMTLGYAAAVTAWALFQIKFSSDLEMVPYRTTATSLCFNARMMAQLTPPLAFFYLGWIAENGLRSGDWLNNQGEPPIYMENAFVQFYQVSVIPGVGDLSVTFPIILFSIVFLFVTGLFNRVMVAMDWKKFQIGDEIVTKEQLRDGQRQLERYKSVMVRNAQRSHFRSLIHGSGKNNNNDNHTTNEDNAPRASMLARTYNWLAGSIINEKENLIPNNENSSSSNGERVISTATAATEETISTPEEMKMWVQVYKDSWFDRWRKRYMFISSGVVRFYHNEDDIEVSSPDMEFDVRVISSFQKHRPNKENKTKTLLLQMNNAGDIEHKKDKDSLFKIKFYNDESLEDGMQLLREWKDYVMDSIADVITPRMSASADRLSGIQIALEEGNVNNDTNTNEKSNGSGRMSSNYSGDYMDTGDIYTNVTDSTNQPEQLEGQPKAISGQLELKIGNSNSVSYKKKYLLVNLLGFFVYTKKLKAGTPVEPEHIIDLRLVPDIEAYIDNKGTTHQNKFALDTGMVTYHFKIPQNEMNRNWIKSLNEWREYHLFNF